MINFLKKLYIILFTKNPYKVISFNNLIRRPIGEPVGIRETLNNVLIEEKGKLIFYPSLPKSYNNILTEEKVKLVMLCSIIYPSMLVASGELAFSIFPGRTAHDGATVKIIVEEAGGKVTDIFGEEQRYDGEIRGFIASNGE